MGAMNRFVFITACTCALWVFSISGAWAQEMTPAPKAKTFADVWKEGGWVMYPLALASVLMVGLSTEGFYKLRKEKLCPSGLVASAKQLMTDSSFQELWKLCQANPCFFSTVVAAGLERIGRGKERVESVMTDIASKEATLLKTKMRYLSVIGVVTPMIGLTGTVVGMIKAFAVLGSSGIADPAALSSKISEVLIATAGGLGVAIPAFIFYYVLGNKAQSAIIEADSVINRLFEDIPYDELTGLRVGDSFTAGQASSTGVSGRTVSMTLTTNCPICNGVINPGDNPCPHCGAELKWAE